MVNAKSAGASSLESAQNAINPLILNLIFSTRLAFCYCTIHVPPTGFGMWAPAKIGNNANKWPVNVGPIGILAIFLNLFLKKNADFQKKFLGPTYAQPISKKFLCIVDFGVKLC